MRTALFKRLSALSSISCFFLIGTVHGTECNHSDIQSATVMGRSIAPFPATLEEETECLGFAVAECNENLSDAIDAMEYQCYEFCKSLSCPAFPFTAASCHPPTTDLSSAGNLSCKSEGLIGMECRCFEPEPEIGPDPDPIN